MQNNVIFNCQFVNNQNNNSFTMRAQNSNIFSSKTHFSSILHKNSSILSPFQSRLIHPPPQNSAFRIVDYNLGQGLDKQKVLSRCNVTIQYVPEFSFVSQTQQAITIKIKQYTLQLLPWLIKKEPLFKVNIVLGIYIAFLQLVDMYGLFPLHPNMMKVNQKQQVAIWINKNFQALQPDQILTNNAFSMRQFIKSFLRIFKCCLPNKRMPEIYNDSKQLLNELTKIKRKEEMHKNCHQFIKHDTKLHQSRKSNKCQSNIIFQSLQQLPSSQRYSTKLIKQSSFTPTKQNGRFSSFSPPKRTQNKLSSLQKFNQTTGFKNKCSMTFERSFLKNKNSHIRTETNLESNTQQKQFSICTTGHLFKRYLMYSTSKYQKMSKSNTLNQEFNFKGVADKSNLIFRSEVYRLNENSFSHKVIEERNSVQVLSQQLGMEEQQFSPIRFRKMSSNTSERIQKKQSDKKFMKSGGGRNTYKQPDNYLFGCQQNDENSKNSNKQKLKSSFPYKTSSTLNSFRLSNQHQYHIFPSKSEQNLNACSLQSIVPLSQKQKDKKIEEMKIEEQNELESDFNNIFSMQNSKVRNQEEDKKMEIIMNEFQQILF